MCEECLAWFSTHSKMNRHYREQHLQKKKTFPCGQCGSIFKRKEHLARHIRSTHQNKRLYCPLCPSSYIQGSKLKTHLQEKHGVYKCGKCHSIVNLISSELHTCSSIDSPLQELFNCQLCPKTYKRKAYLSKHLLSVHVKKRKGKPKNTRAIEIQRARSQLRELEEESCELLTIKDQHILAKISDTSSKNIVQKGHEFLSINEGSLIDKVITHENENQPFMSVSHINSCYLGKRVQLPLKNDQRVSQEINKKQVFQDQSAYNKNKIPIFFNARNPPLNIQNKEESWTKQLIKNKTTKGEQNLEKIKVFANYKPESTFSLTKKELYFSNPDLSKMKLMNSNRLKSLFCSSNKSAFRKVVGP